MAVLDIANKSVQSATPWGAIAGAAGSVIGALTANTRRKQQMADQQKLMGLQQQNQMALNQQGAQLAKENWNYTNYENQVKHMENAGLNVGLMYGSAGQGGSLASGSGGGAAGGSAPTQENALGIMGLQLQQMQNQNELTKAQVAKLNEETAGVKIDNDEKLGKTDKGKYTIENLRQAGIKDLNENFLNEWMNSSPSDEVNVYKNDKYDYQYGTTDTSRRNQQFNTSLLKLESEKNQNLANIDLTNQKIQGYWTELMNATKQADAAATQAAAQKLSAEWNTGEFTNWKTWVDVAKGAIESVSKLIKPKFGTPKK